MFLQTKHTNGQKVPEKMLKITNHQGNANQTHSENDIDSHIYQDGVIKMIKIKNTEDKYWSRCGEIRALAHCW
jgi:hypothetical protein